MGSPYRAGSPFASCSLDSIYITFPGVERIKRNASTSQLTREVSLSLGTVTRVDLQSNFQPKHLLCLSHLAEYRELIGYPLMLR